MTTPGLYADRIPAKPTDLAILTEALSELNRTPGTLSDEQQARALKRILAQRGLAIRENDRG